jgi:hypothetical protein
MSITPGIQIPRANFDRSRRKMTTIDFDYIYPVYWDEVYPNDTFTMSCDAFGRVATLLYPNFDNMYLDVHFFFVPMRILWTNARKFWGEQEDPGDSIAYTIPSMNATTSTGYSELSIFDYFGLPTKVPDYEHITLPLRAYNFIWNEWYRDQNLQPSITVRLTDGSDDPGDFGLQKRGKRHDYFTGGLVELQEGGVAQDLPLGTTAPVTKDLNAASGGTGEMVYNLATANLQAGNRSGTWSDATTVTGVADLSSATAATIAELRQAVAIQKLLELDARSGNRFPEMIYATYGVIFDDVSYRPEFLGGSSQRVDVNQVPQTSNDGVNGNIGDLGANGTIALRGAGFTKSFTEPGYVIGLMSARADITYQQGLRREWSRSTRYDFLHPLLQGIGDQATLVKEIYCQNPATDTGSTGTPDNERTFNYQERYAELKYGTNEITGLFRSNCTSSLEAWHLSEEFSSLPSFDSTFIGSNTPMDRAIAVPSEPHLVVDMKFNLQCVRPMHMYSIPGLGTSL